MQYRGFWYQGRKFCTESFKRDKTRFENGDCTENIEIAHRLVEIKTKWPIIIKLRYRDTEWDVMKNGHPVITWPSIHWKATALRV